MATGDKKNALKKLQSSTRTIKYTNIDYNEINIGSPKEYLKLYHYLLLEYNPLIPLEILNKYQIELSGKTDKLFIDSVYKLMRDMLNYKPLINKEQFFTTGYVELKALMACEFINLIQQKFRLHLTYHHSTATASSTHPHNSTTITSALSTSTGSATGSAYHVNGFGTLNRHHTISSIAQYTAQQRNNNENNEMLFHKKSTINRVPSINNKTPLVQNHRILNSNLKQMELNQDESNGKKKDTLLEILTKSDEQLTTSNSNESSINGNDATVIQQQQQQQSFGNSTNNKNNKNFDELSEKYEFLLNRIDNMEQNLINSTKASLVPVSTVNDDNTVTITRNEYQGLISRITLLENELILIKKFKEDTNRHSNEIRQANLQIMDKQTRSSIPSNLRIQPQPQAPIQPQQHYIEDISYAEDSTFYASFNNDDSDLQLTPSNNANQRPSLLTQGTLFHLINNQNSNDTQDTSQNDLTPTADDDPLSRARMLLNRASAFNDELVQKVKV